MLQFREPAAAFDQEPEFIIRRAWRPKEIPLDPEGGQPPAEIWCVDLELNGERDGLPQVESMEWFLAREKDQQEWRVAPLLTMSTIWPNQACGMDGF